MTMHTATRDAMLTRLMASRYEAEQDVRDAEKEYNVAHAAMLDAQRAEMEASLLLEVKTQRLDAKRRAANAAAALCDNVRQLFSELERETR